MSDSKNVRGNESQNVKVYSSFKYSFAGHAVYEEMKEIDIDAQEKGRLDPLRNRPIEENEHGALLQTKIKRDYVSVKEYEGISSYEHVQGYNFESKLPLKVTDLDKVESKHSNKEFEVVKKPPLLSKKTLPVEIDPDDDSLNEKKQSNLKKKIKREQTCVVGNYFGSEDDKNDMISVDSGEKAADNPKNLVSDKNQLKSRTEQVKYGESANLFTMPDSPRQVNQFRNNDDQEISNFEPRTKYSSWIVNYYFSALLYNHSNYSRFSRCSQGVCSFYLKTVLIGLLVT